MGKANKKLEIVSGDIEEHKAFAGKNFSPHHLVSFIPKSFPQRDFFRAFHNGVRIIVQYGSAGTGKTACALYAALGEAFSKESSIDKVKIVRSAVPTRDVGFLPGTKEEKDAVYEKPYVALCDELLTFNSRNYENLKAKNIVEFENTSFNRGETWDYSIVIIDEFQSMTYHELSTLISRAGINTRIILCGDIKQNDLHKKGDVSGFDRLIKVLNKMPSEYVEMIEYHPQDILRNDLVKEFIIADESVE